MEEQFDGIIQSPDWLCIKLFSDHYRLGLNHPTYICFYFSKMGMII